MATATRGTTKKKNTRSPSLSAVLLARKKTVHCQSVTLDSKTLHPEWVTVHYCAWFTSASVLFNLLVCPRADVRRTSYVSWGQHTSPGGPLPPTRQHPTNRHYSAWLVHLLLSHTTHRVFLLSVQLHRARGSDVCCDLSDISALKKSYHVWLCS